MRRVVGSFFLILGFAVAGLAVLALLPRSIQTLPLLGYLVQFLGAPLTCILLFGISTGLFLLSLKILIPPRPIEKMNERLKERMR